MRLPSIFLLTSIAAVVAANDLSPLLRRQTPATCQSLGQKTCGVGCIDLTDTCCPDRAGGCPVGTYCDLGSNGQYGCCRNGRTCSGPGGVITSNIGTGTVAQPTSTRVFTTPVFTPPVFSTPAVLTTRRTSTTDLNDPVVDETSTSTTRRTSATGTTTGRGETSFQVAGGIPSPTVGGGTGGAAGLGVPGGLLAVALMAI